MNRFLKSLLILFLTWSVPGKGYFVMGRMWEKSEESGKTRYIVALGDRHEPHGQGLQQLCQLMDRIPLNALVIVESPEKISRYKESLNCWMRNKKIKISKPSCACCSLMLHNISEICHKCTIRADRLEFRSDDSDINDKARDIDEWIETLEATRLTCGEIANKLKPIIVRNSQHINKVKVFEDGVLQEVYNNLIVLAEDVNNALEALTRIFEQDEMQNKIANIQMLKPVIAYLIENYVRFTNGGEEITDSRYLERLMIDSNRVILDVYILHSLYTHRDAPVVFICAGNAHIDGITDVIIEKLGYKQIKHIEGRDISPYRSIDVKAFLEPKFFPVTILQTHKHWILGGLLLASGVSLGGYYIYSYLWGR